MHTNALLAPHALAKRTPKPAALAEAQEISKTALFEDMVVSAVISSNGKG
jgi:hypothetical protein